MNRYLIIEDEKPNADRLIRLIKEIEPSAQILGTLESIKDSIDWLNAHPAPDILMMDIRLTDGVSFGIFEKTKVDCPVIFTTAYDQYAIQAFKHNGIDYLLKPIDSEELKDAIAKVFSTNTHFDKNAIIQLVKELKPKEYRTKFLLPFKDGFKIVEVSDITYIFIEHRISTAYLKNNGTATLPQSMDELEATLDPKLFFRANRQYIIHVDAVKQLLNHFNGKLKMVLKYNDLELIISREKSALLKEWLSY